MMFIRPGGKLTRNNQVNTKARKQSAGKAINPFRQTLIATAHFRQREQAGDYGKPASVSGVINAKIPQRAAAPTLSPTNSEKRNQNR